MVYELPVKSRIEFIALKIRNINQMVDFYTKVIGLYLIKRTESQAYLGIPSRKRVFISLKKINHPSKNRNVANMKSFSLILPDRDSLKRIMVHINKLGIKIPGVKISTDLDMFYLNDPEGNCVSLGARKSMQNKKNAKSASWFDPFLKKISLSRYLKNFKLKSDKLPNSTRFGWIDMVVPDLHSSLHFYHSQLGLKYEINADKSRVILGTDRNSFHQIVLTQKSSLTSRAVNNLGLDYMDIKMSDSYKIANLAKNLTNSGADCQYSEPNHFIFITDPDDINIMVSLL